MYGRYPPPGVNTRTQWYGDEANHWDTLHKPTPGVTKVGPEYVWQRPAPTAQSNIRLPSGVIPADGWQGTPDEHITSRDIDLARGKGWLSGGKYTPPAEAKPAVGMDKQNAEKLAAVGVGDILGGATGLAALGGAAGLAIPAGLAYGGGRLLGSARNQMDVDDAETLKLKAEANAYRRRAAEAQLGAQVRKIVASDPKKYVVIG
jgi:hypothetical protein